jgi:hypothetical protein
VELHVAFDLIKELIPRFDMKVEPRIRPTKYHDQEVLMTNNEAIRPEWRVEVILVFFNPTFEMVSGKKVHRGPPSAAPGIIGVME